MKLRGIGLDPVPYIPQVELESNNPTVFWIRPKTVGLVQNLSKYSTFSDLPNYGSYLYTEKVKEFLSVCTMVENFEFSIENKDLHKQGVVKEVTDKALLTIVALEIPSAIFDEVLNESNSTSFLSAGQRKGLELMTYFALTKNEDMPLSERLSYNCDTCQVMSKHLERKCFLLNEINQIQMPVLGEQDDFTGEYGVEESKEKDFTVEEFLEEFFNISTKMFPDVPAYISLLRIHHFLSWDKEVCVTGLFDSTFIQVLDWALDCKNMSALPYPGSYFDQPNQLMEAFKAIHSTISEYEKVRMDNMSKKSKGNKDGSR